VVVGSVAAAVVVVDDVVVAVVAALPDAGEVVSASIGLLFPARSTK